MTNIREYTMKTFGIELPKIGLNLHKHLEIKRRHATVKLDNMVARITFNVHIDDLEKYYRNGFIFVEKKE